MQIIFSQGPTKHSRIGNSLLWMARAYPLLANSKGVEFVFPWAHESFSSYLEHDSPWGVNPNDTPAADLFTTAFGIELNANNVSNTSRYLESQHEASLDIPAFSWKSICTTLSIKDLAIGYAVGRDVKIVDLLSALTDVDLLIIHEPYDMSYPGDRFPTIGLDHIRPRDSLISESRNFVGEHSSPGSLGSLGLHIRRGDYRSWQGGKHFHADEYWLHLAKNNLDQGLDGFVFTNEEEGDLSKALVDLGCSLSSGTAIQDFTRMMFLDKIIGPPSTFPLLARMISKSCLGREIEVVMIDPN
jgi:hypothetical protein